MLIDLHVLIVLREVFGDRQRPRESAAENYVLKVQSMKYFVAADSHCYTPPFQFKRDSGTGELRVENVYRRDAPAKGRT
ncbi:hypothetical protein EVAR_99163_1 [Eumeta japonica]|uniref:Uncharacterized protein n=1 Tax=Eumeta variegata TaxID=151549 RepID=A0A4C1S9E4_EUMVA|nr:hypothetical protein EVAR_99163_1 [Eumeta japonica]